MPERLHREMLASVGPTGFVGYDHVRAEARIIAIVRGDEQVEAAGADDEVELFLDATPFYAEAGGQVGDAGEIATETGAARVADTRHAVPGLHGHLARVTAGSVRVGQDATAAIDADRRERIRKSHTGTHLLHWALRQVIGDQAHQAGSLVEAGRLRFDFSHSAALASEELAAVEEQANLRIIENAAVTTYETSKEQADRLGAIAFFGDKYGDRVRVVEAGEYSRELCGGTHVPSTGQVGPLLVTTESSIAANVRRIEALTGAAAYEEVVRLRRVLADTAGALRAQAGGVVAAAASLADRSRAQEQRIEMLAAQLRAHDAGDLAEQAEERAGVRLVVAMQGSAAPDELRNLALAVREEIGEGLVILGSDRDGKGGLVAAASPGLVAAGLSAGAVIAPAAKLLGGGGAPKPDLAQAGGPRGDLIDDALEEARTVARRTIADLQGGP